jgi:hypothetical protein
MFYVQVAGPSVFLLCKVKNCHDPTTREQTRAISCHVGKNSACCRNRSHAQNNSTSNTNRTTTTEHQQHQAKSSAAAVFTSKTRMEDQTPKKPEVENVTTAKTKSDASLFDQKDPPGYIGPDQQDMMLIDITSDILHSDICTSLIGRGNTYLSEAKSFPLEWPALGVILSTTNAS